MRDFARNLLLRWPQQAGERHEAAIGGAYVHQVEPRKIFAKTLIGLHVDAIRVVAVIEVVDVRRSFERAERVRNGLEGNAERLGLVTVDLKIVLRRVVVKRCKHTGEAGVGVGRVEQAVSRRHHAGKAGIAFIEYLKLKPAVVADALHCRRIEGEHLRFGLLREQRIKSPENRRERVLRTAAFAPGFEWDKRYATIWSTTGESESVDVKHPFGFRNGGQNTLR